MAGLVRPLPANQTAGPQLSFCSKLKQLAEIIVQIAIRVLFVAVSILAAAAAFPIDFHILVLPIVASGSTLLAGFFFPQTNRISAPYFDNPPPLIRPIPPDAPGRMPANMPLDAPRGLINISNNCPFNSLVQFLENDPFVAHWMRHPLTPNTDMPTFLAFMAGYNPPQQLMNDFAVYAAAQVPPRPIPAMFTDFMNGYRPPLQIIREFQNIKEKFEHIQILHGAYSNFLSAYDQALQGNLAVVNADSQALRWAYNRLSEVIDPSPHVQLDASELMRYTLDLLPDAQKMKIETTYHFNMNGRPPMAEPVLPKREPVPFLTLEFNDNDPAPTLERMIQNYMDHGDVEPLKRIGTDGIKHEYPIDRCTVRALEPPPALRLHIKRFTFEKGAKSWWSTWFPSLFPPLPGRAVKKDNPIELPNELDYCGTRYRLASFMHHSGSLNSGHYTGGRIVNGQRYFISDTQVTPVDQATWDERLRYLYVVLYLPV